MVKICFHFGKRGLAFSRRHAFIFNFKLFFKRSEQLLRVGDLRLRHTAILNLEVLITRFERYGFRLYTFYCYQDRLTSEPSDLRLTSQLLTLRSRSRSAVRPKRRILRHEANCARGRRRQGIHSAPLDEGGPEHWDTRNSSFRPLAQTGYGSAGSRGESALEQRTCGGTDQSSQNVEAPNVRD